MKRITAILCIVIILISMVGYSQKSQIVGKWYHEEWDVVYFVFYSDGTYQEYNHYGTGTWDIVDGYLKLTDYYGSTRAFEFEVHGDTLTLSKSGDSVDLRRVN